MVDEVRVRAHPWIPVRNSGDLQAVGKLVEELGELTALLSRCTIQGVNECEPVTSKLNKLAIEEEVANVIIGLRLFARRFDLDRRAISTRRPLRRSSCHRSLE